MSLLATLKRIQQSRPQSLLADSLSMAPSSPSVAQPSVQSVTTTQEPLIINSFTPNGGGRTLYEVNTNKGDYYYYPSEFVAKGFITDDNLQFYEPALLNQDVLKNAIPVNISSEVLQGKKILDAGWQNPGQGILLPKDTYQKYVDDGQMYYGISPEYPAIQGMSMIEAAGSNSPETGVKYVLGGNTDNRLQFINPNARFTERTVTIEKKGGILGSAIRGVGNFFGNVPIVGDVAAFALGGPALLGIAKGGQVASVGGSPLDAFKAGAISGGLLSAGQALSSGGQIQGIEGFANAADEVGGAGAFPPAPAVPTVDYSLLGSANLPTQAAGMGGGTGITATLPPLPEPSAIGIQPIDYGLTWQTLPGIVGGIGLQQPTMPNIGTMGGAQGVTVPVEGGTVGALGFTPETAVPVLGSPGSFINNPEVLGQPVIQQGTPTSPISIQDALRGARMVNNLLNKPEQPAPNMLNRAQEILKTPGSVDYTSLLGLLNQRAQVAGLLGTRYQPQSINLASLLG